MIQYSSQYWNIAHRSEINKAVMKVVEIIDPDLVF